MEHTKVYECEMCGKTFTNKKSRRLHRKTHNKVPSASAANPSCSTTSGNQTSSQQKPTTSKQRSTLQCSFCNKVQHSKRDFQNHIAAIHTSYNCADCTKSFNTRKSFAAHQKLHKKKYQCSQCAKTFMYATLLKRHMKVQHGVKAKTIKEEIK